MSSFLRQLNFYGFKRTFLETSQLNYYHPEFKRDEANFYIQKKVRTKALIDSIQIKQIKQELQEIKLKQIQMQSQFQQCAGGFTEISHIIQNLLNGIFLSKLNISIQARGFLVTILKIVLGMQKEKKASYEELLRIMFSPGDIDTLEATKQGQLSNFSEFSPLPILQYMFSSSPVTPLEQTSQIVNILEKLAAQDDAK